MESFDNYPIKFIMLKYVKYQFQREAELYGAQ